MPRKKAKASIGGATATRLVREMNAYHKDLASQCAVLQAEMDGIGAALSAMGAAAAAPKRGPGRPKGSKAKKAPAAGGKSGRGRRPAGGSLKDFIVKVLKTSSGTISVKNIAGGVKRAGYKTKSQNLGNQVSMALIELVKARKVKKVGRGQYRR